jgi:polysaccharide export outer membrane protein
LAAAAHLAAGSASAKDGYAAPMATQTAPDYILGPGDKIRVITFGEESLTGAFLVGATGRVSLPLIGEVQAGGRTTGQVAAEMARMLADGFLKDPRVSIEVVDFRPYYILGEVNKPGLYPYTAGLTVDGAVATAGGFTYRANTHKVFIRPAQGSAERKMPLTSGALVHPGDTVRIAERYF